MRILPREPLRALSQLTAVLLMVLFTGAGYLAGQWAHISFCLRGWCTEEHLTTAAWGSSLLSWLLLAMAALGMSQLTIGPLGLVHSLPPLYFLSAVFGLVSGFITVRISKARPWLQGSNCFFLLILLWLVPILLEGTPRFASSYKTIGFAEYIQRTSIQRSGNFFITIGQLSPCLWLPWASLQDWKICILLLFTTPLSCSWFSWQFSIGYCSQKRGSWVSPTVGTWVRFSTSWGTS